MNIDAGNKNGSLVFLKKRAGPNVNDMMMIRNRCHQELNLDMNKWKMTLSFRMTIVRLSHSESDIIWQLTARFQQHMMHYLLIAPVFFALVFTFYAYLSESVSTH